VQLVWRSDIGIGCVEWFHPVFVFFRTDTMGALINHETEFFFFFQGMDKVDNGFAAGTLNNV